MMPVMIIMVMPVAVPAAGEIPGRRRSAGRGQSGNAKHGGKQDGYVMFHWDLGLNRYRGDQYANGLYASISKFEFCLFSCRTRGSRIRIAPAVSMPEAQTPERQPEICSSPVNGLRCPSEGSANKILSVRCGSGTVFRLRPSSWEAF